MGGEIRRSVPVNGRQMFGHFITRGVIVKLAEVGGLNYQLVAANVSHGRFNRLLSPFVNVSVCRSHSDSLNEERRVQTGSPERQSQRKKCPNVVREVQRTLCSFQGENRVSKSLCTMFSIYNDIRQQPRFSYISVYFKI